MLTAISTSQLRIPLRTHFTGDNVFVTTDHMGEPMPLNTVVQNTQTTLTEYNVKIHEQAKVNAAAQQRTHPVALSIFPLMPHVFSGTIQVGRVKPALA